MLRNSLITGTALLALLCGNAHAEGFNPMGMINPSQWFGNNNNNDDDYDRYRGYGPGYGYGPYGGAPGWGGPYGGYGPYGGGYPGYGYGPYGGAPGWGYPQQQQKEAPLPQ